MTILRESAMLGDKELVLETGRIARQAGGSVLVQYGDTVVLVAATEGGPRDLPFFPMTVDYQEKTYASGRIPGSYFKREGRLGEHEILTCRLIDRPVRPLFTDGYNNDTQIMATVVSMDGENEPDVLSITGASAALMISDVPFEGPIAGVRVGMVDGELVANPTVSERADSDLDIVVVCSQDAIVMVEGQANELEEEVMLEALDFARDAVRDVLDLQLRLREACGRDKLECDPDVLDPALYEAVQKLAGKKIGAAITVVDKEGRRDAVAALRREVVEKLEEKFEDTKAIKKSFDKLKKAFVRNMVAREKVRIDGRSPSDVRPISTEVGVLPRTHGSSLFTRGETQALVTVTLGTEDDRQRYDTLLGQKSRTFMLHYNFPPYSVGETRPVRGPGRREIGHGILARRALGGMLPAGDDDWPYTIRIVSEITESNGSSSMASVCGGTMALMDAGVPITRPVAGIAMGLIKEGDDIVVLSDILGDEDHLGDMDFKVCGTEKGITAFQMDTKIAGITRATMKKALLQARDGRLHILDNMLGALAEPRPELSPHAPRIVSIRIKPNQIGGLIGPGGRTIRGIVEQTGVKINVEDDGTVTIASADQAMSDKAVRIIENLTQEPEVGKTYLGTVRKVVDFGAFIQILPGTDGLCHISELTEGRVDRVEDVLSEGDEVLVKCIGIDRGGKIKLSRKEALADQGESE